MFALVASYEEVVMRRRFDEDEDEFDGDSFQFDEDDDDDDDDGEEDEDLEEGFEIVDGDEEE